MRGAGRLGAVLALALLGTPLAVAADSEALIQLKDAPGREVTAAHCAQCHSLEYIPANAPALDRAGWQKTVQKMRERFGAPISDEEARAILDYLGTSYSGKS
jgi:mono/diheme cytochrome c family protein